MPDALPFSFLCCSRSVFLAFAIDQRRHRFGDGLAVRVKEEHLDLRRLRPVGVRPLERHGFFILAQIQRALVGIVDGDNIGLAVLAAVAVERHALRIGIPYRQNCDWSGVSLSPRT